MGIDVILIHKEGGYSQEYSQYVTEIIHADFTNDYDSVERIALQQHAEAPLKRVMSFTEDGLVPAARLNSLLGLGGNSLESVWRLKDKAWMRSCLADHQLSPVRSRLVKNADELAYFVTEHSYRAVVKPVRGVGSVGIFHLEGPDEVTEVWNRITESGHTLMLVEEHLDGPEFSVESLSWQGRHHILAITRKALHGNMEIGHSMPALLTPEQNAQIAATVQGLLDSVGITEGPCHTELRLTKDGPRIIESHNRMGGSAIGGLVHLTVNLDITRLAISIPLGIDPPLTESPTQVGGAAVRHFLPDPGIVKGITGTELISTDARLSLLIGVQPGDTVHEQLTNFDRDALGTLVIAGGTDETDAIRRCEEVIDTVQIVTKGAAQV